MKRDSDLASTRIKQLSSSSWAKVAILQLGTPFEPAHYEATAIEGGNRRRDLVTGQVICDDHFAADLGAVCVIDLGADVVVASRSSILPRNDKAAISEHSHHRAGLKTFAGGVDRQLSAYPI